MSIKILPKQSLTALRDNILPLIRRFSMVFFFLSFIFSLKLIPVETLPITQLLTDISKHPYTQIPHIRLAHLYLTMGNLQGATLEWNLVQFVGKRPVEPVDVLGETLEYTQVQKQLLEVPQDTQRIFHNWQQIAITYPNYRDAWVQLLYMAFNSGNLNEARIYINKIKSLDINYPNQLAPELQILK